jgi:hypothetical protein
MSITFFSFLKSFLAGISCPTDKLILAVLRVLRQRKENGVLSAGKIKPGTLLFRVPDL